MSTCNDLVTRRLTPADVGSIARVHCAAFTDSGITALGEAMSERYYHWQLQQSVMATIIGAERQGQLVGFCLVAESFGSMIEFVRTHALAVAAQLIRRPWAAWHFRSQIAAALPSVARRRRSANSAVTANRPAAPKRPELWIHAIAVDPSQQRLGIGGRLMREAEAFAAQQGYDHMLLAVVTTNQAAISLYEAAGWCRVPNDASWRGRMRKSLAKLDDGRSTLPTRFAS